MNWDDPPIIKAARRRLHPDAAAFLLLGGSLGDRFGRRKVYMIGIV